MATNPNLWQLLRRRYPENAYAMMQEVSDAAGFSRSRSADYVIVSLWPSRGLHITGIEVKSFRNDWLRELKNPAKSENIFKNCDFFYLLTTDETIAKAEEIPDTWGWLVVKGNRIVTMKEAPKQSPPPVSRNFICAMLKRASEKESYVHISVVDEKIATLRELDKPEMERKIAQMERDSKRLQDAVSKFEEKSGININHYNIGPHNEKLGEAVKFILNGGLEKQRKELQSMHDDAMEIANKINAALKISSAVNLVTSSPNPLITSQ